MIDLLFFNSYENFIDYTSINFKNSKISSILDKNQALNNITFLKNSIIFMYFYTHV